MTSSDEEFHQWLLATFREEADEILTGISNGLIELEKEGSDPGPELVEQIYRKTHSLKGAARAVNLRDIESICQNSETVFSLIKQGVLIPDPEVFDLLHKSISVIYSILSGEKTTGIGSAEIVLELRALTTAVAPVKKPTDLQAEGENSPLSPWNNPFSTPGSSLPSSSGSSFHVKVNAPDLTLESGCEDSSNIESLCALSFEKTDPIGHSGGDSIPSQAQGRGTVRIAAHKLDRLIAGSEDLLTTRLYIAHRLRELEEMMSRFSLWKWNHTQIEGDVHQIREVTYGAHKADLPPEIILPLERIADFLKFDREFVMSMHHDLGVHIRATEVDQSALESSTSEISDLIHDAVLVPIASVFASFSKFVREYSRGVGKIVDFQVDGKDIEMDRRILETIKPSLMHLIHNCIDHGIEYPDVRAALNKPERGSIQIRISTHSGSKVAIEVIDDGAGIDLDMIRHAAVEKGIISGKQGAIITDEEALWLIFRSGFSTNSEVSDLSGRGLGLAIVDDTITRLGGELMVSSEPLHGTTITIILPVRLATLRGLVARSGSQRYVFPVQQIKKVIRADPDLIFYQGNRMAIRIDDEPARVIRLTDVLSLPDTTSFIGGENPIPIILIEYAGRHIACVVDDVIRVQEIVVRPLGNLLRRVKRITGAALLGDGSAVMVLDLLEIIQEAFSPRGQPTCYTTFKRITKRILVVDDSATSRALIRRTLEMAGYQVQTAYDGMDALGKLRETDFHMVVSDVDMPRMNGYTLTEKIRADERFCHIPVLLITSLDSIRDQEYGRAVGANAYIVKSRFESRILLEYTNDLLYNL
jgi:two-component system chemotaxis sensor kinase CheA